MGYSKDIYDDAFEELKARRNKAEYDAMIKHSELIKKLPRVQEIEESLAKQVQWLLVQYLPIE